MREMAVRRAIRWPAVLAAALASTAASAGDAPGHFDGMWRTTVSCAAARDALGYSYRFASTVKGSVLHGVHGVVGQGGSLEIDGPIQADGSAHLYAKGRTGSKEFVPGRDTPRGTEFGYEIDAQFEAAAGTGTRVEGRPCTLQFEKQ